MGQQTRQAFIRHSGIAAPYLKHDVRMEHIAAPSIGSHNHSVEQGQATVHGHDRSKRESSQGTEPQLGHVFETERSLHSGETNPSFILNQDPFMDASILLTGRNFGLGGTQTPAASALVAYGYRAVIAVSFGTVFFDDCVQTGLLALIIGQDQILAIADKIITSPGVELVIDLEQQVISRPDMQAIAFELNPRLRRKYMLGLQDVDETSPFNKEAEEFQRGHRLRQPWLYQTGNTLD